MKNRKEQSEKQKKINKENRQKELAAKQKALKEKHRVESIIPDKIDNLSISIDFDDNWDEIAQRFPVILFTPDMNNTAEHWHIRLSDNQAIHLNKWLDEFLKMKGLK